MRLATIKLRGGEKAALALERHYLPLAAINAHWGTRFAENVFELICEQQLTGLAAWCRHHQETLGTQATNLAIEETKVSFAPLLRHPRKIWGIGLNYQAHAADLNEQSPRSEPASFMKPDTTIIGSSEAIQIPVQSQRTTAEAELAIVIGKRCKGVRREQVGDFIAGYVSVIDVTAEDILRRNPRYLTRAKSFDTFFSIGPVLRTPEEIQDLPGLAVATLKNGQVYRENTIARMMFSPHYLVWFHSHVMTLLPGDIISTGTPGATPIAHGDRVACRITGFELLENTVVDLKKQS